METWHRLSEIKRSTADTITAKAVLPLDSPWFSGHFPGEPILPGVAQIALVAETLRRGLDRKLKITGLKRTRFKQIIVPGDTLAIEIDVQDKTAAGFVFRVLIRGEIACTGTITAA